MANRRSREQRQSRMAERTGDAAKNRDKGFKNTTLDLPEGIEFIELKKRVRLNIIPYEVTTANHPDKKNGYPDKGDLWWKRPILVHKRIGVNNDNFICPRTIGKQCPICEEIDMLSQEYTKNKEIIGKIRAKKRDVMIVQDADDPDKGIWVFDVSYHMFTKLLLEEIDEGKEEYLRFAEQTDGFTLSCRFSEEKFNGKPYWEINRIDFDERKDYSDKLMGKAIALDDILIVPSYDDLKAAFMQIGDDDLDTDEAGEEGTKPEDIDSDDIDNADPAEVTDLPEETDDPDIDVNQEKADPEELEGEDLVGKVVTYTADGESCEVKSFDEKTDVYVITDKDGEDWDVARDEFTIEDAEEPEPEKEEKASRSSRGKKGDKAKSSNKCPYDYRFGKDCGKKTECQKDCDNDTWDACQAENEKLEGK